MKCPYCSEEIQDAAVVCRHCGRDFSPLKPLLQRIDQLENQLRGPPPPPLASEHARRDHSVVVATAEPIQGVILQPPSVFWVAAVAAILAFVLIATPLTMGYGVLVGTPDVTPFGRGYSVRSEMNAFSPLISIAIAIICPLAAGAWIGKHMPSVSWRRTSMASLVIAVGTAGGLVPYQLLEKFAIRASGTTGSAAMSSEAIEDIRVSVLDAAAVLIAPDALLLVLMFTLSALLLVLSGRAVGLRLRGDHGAVKPESALQPPDQVIAEPSVTELPRSERLSRTMAALGPLLTVLAGLIGSILTFIATILTAK